MLPLTYYTHTHTHTHTILDLRAEIDAVNQRFIDAINKQDLTALSKVYASDCKLMPPGMDVQHGREGIVTDCNWPDHVMFLCSIA